MKPSLLRIILAAQLFVACGAAAAPTDPLPASKVEIDALATRVAGAGDSVARTQRLVSWMSSRLQWVATDYEERTPEQILARGAGNCAELASVLERLLQPTGISYRWVAEINLQPVSAERQADAVALIRQRGVGASVFGLRHNDHRWLEIRDDRSQEWVPADPATGLVGTSAWAIKALRTNTSLQPLRMPSKTFEQSTMTVWSFLSYSTVKSTLSSAICVQSN